MFKVSLKSLSVLHPHSNDNKNNSMSLFLLEEVIYTVKHKPDGHKTKPDQTLLNKGGENTHNNCKKVRTTLMELHIK